MGGWDRLFRKGLTMKELATLPEWSSLELDQGDKKLVVHWKNTSWLKALFNGLFGTQIISSQLIGLINLALGKYNQQYEVQFFWSLTLSFILLPLAIYALSSSFAYWKFLGKGSLIIHDGFLEIIPSACVTVILLGQGLGSSCSKVICWPFCTHPIHISQQDLFVTSFSNKLRGNRKVTLLTKEFLIYIYPSSNPLDNIWLTKTIQTWSSSSGIFNSTNQDKLIYDSFWNSSVGIVLKINIILFIISFFSMPYLFSNR